jgi:hypothetical protein
MVLAAPSPNISHQLAQLKPIVICVATRIILIPLALAPSSILTFVLIFPTSRDITTNSTQYGPSTRTKNIAFSELTTQQASCDCTSQTCA